MQALRTFPVEASKVSAIEILGLKTFRLFASQPERTIEGGFKIEY